MQRRPTRATLCFGDSRASQNDWERSTSVPHATILATCASYSAALENTGATPDPGKRDCSTIRQDA